jgi:hypothetical protein
MKIDSGAIPTHTDHDMQLSNLSPMQLRQAAELKEKICALQEELNQLAGGAVEAAVTEAPERPQTARRGKRRLSARGRANILAGVAKRIAKKAGSAPAWTRGNGTSPEGELTVKAAILETLASGEAMAKKEIAEGVATWRGKKTNPNSLNLALYELKTRDKTIMNPERGVYQLR